MVHYKRLPLEGLHNARDLGGFRAEGGVTRYGVFVRSEVPKALTEADIKFLQEYGVTTSLDLRGRQESKAPASVLAELPGHRYVLCPMEDPEAAAASAAEEKRPEPEFKPEPPKTVGPGEKSFFDIEWTMVYIDILERGKAWVKNIFEQAAACEGCLLYHCFTGKDRTGMFTALLLGVCGVSKTDIIGDYSLSMSYLRPFYRDMSEAPYFVDGEGRPDYSRGFYCTAPETIERTMEHLEEKYGSITDYVLACGVSESTVAAIREKLIEKI